MDYNIVAIPGDGIGPEIVREAKKVLDKVGEVYGHKFNYTDILMGGCSIDAYGVPLTDEALETARNSDAVLLGAVGGDVGNFRWYDIAPNLRPEAGLLKIRKGLGLFAIAVISINHISFEASFQLFPPIFPITKYTCLELTV